MFDRYPKSNLLQVLLLLLLPAVPALGAYLMLSPPSPLAGGELTLHQVEALGKEIVWVDARDRDHFEGPHIPKAIWMNPVDMDTGLEGLFDAFSEEKIIVVYCEPDCHASHKVAGRIRELGLEPVYVLHGGFEAWKEQH